MSISSRRAFGFVNLLVLVAVSLAVAAAPNALGQTAPDKKEGDTAQPKKEETKPDAAKRWTILFRADDPSVWNTDSRRAKKFAVPLETASEEIRYLRLRRMDTGEFLILPITYEQLQNGKPPAREVGSWWNGTAKEDWKGRHLGIAEGPRQKFPAPKGMISIMNDGWDAFAGSGFGHKCFVNDQQYYCWRGEEIDKTVFEIAVTDGPLTAEEKRSLVKKK